MAFDYGKMQTLATNLLTDFNQGVINLITVTPGSGPPSNPGLPVRSAPKLLKGAASAAFSVRGASKTYADGTNIQRSDIKVVSKILAGVDPKLTDKITLDGKEYNIIHFNKIPETGTTVAWMFFVRR